ncbi:expressed unknown protein [Seminavis robusta]|uniref:Uncharacterized protein n=1 Tax=Seminavis robusta TaxID=568900 RepID=A0A9N8HME9_9STRA|nr:expressed unknown protein [Seminavis robusta]|eukprot:Sro892_g216970.1 n/a (221) ;mRNA; f:27891-28757
MASRDDASAATTTTDDGSQSADSKALKKKDDGSIDTADLKEKLAESVKESVAIATRSTPDRQCKHKQNVEDSLVINTKGARHVNTRRGAAAGSCSKANKKGNKKKAPGGKPPPGKPKKKSKKVPAVKEESQQRNHGSNFTKKEDIWLARSFITCSKNNLLGANQKDKKFWHKGVEARFNKLAEEETEPDDDGLKSIQPLTSLLQRRTPRRKLRKWTQREL